uniref:NADH-ubiquinone oxidoreductase chain 3 n=1 Tax=Telenomus sp. ZCS-2018 TaxID=2305129 RepID=A0A346PZ55_9HYME|nr:NADH dehydrogenase subunit 3 [Telenomus sp. ZCS-2018]
MMIMIMFLISMIMTILFLINSMLQKKKCNYREKMFPLECGFNQMNKFHLPFSIQFYYISILFLIFDVEIAMIIPMIQKMNFFIINKWMITFSIIMIILLIGLLIEWWNNLIKWK